MPIKLEDRYIQLIKYLAERVDLELTGASELKTLHESALALHTELLQSGYGQ
jgi:hypothetical protein